VVNTLNIHNRPKTTIIHNLPLNSPVLVWREGLIGQLSYWSSPHNLLSIKNETYTIQLPYRPTNFYSMVVKPYLVDPKITKDMQPEDNKNEPPPP
jgi:hypothetical protein